MAKRNKDPVVTQKEPILGSDDVKPKKLKGNALSIKNWAVEAKEKDYLFEGASGFGLRVRPSSKKSPGGNKVFFYKYRFKGKLRFLNLGTYPHTSFATANKAYGDAYSLRKNGLDPITVAADIERQKIVDERKQQTTNKTVESLIKLYIEDYSKINKKTWHKDELVLAQVNKEWKGRLAAEIDKLDLSTFLKQIIKRGSPGQAQNVMESVRAMFNWAVEKGHLAATPFIKVKRSTKKIKSERNLSEKEIIQLWAELDAATNICDEVKRGLKLTLVTGQRSGECIGIHRNEIDGNWWTIPGTKTKNEITHRVYLTSLAFELIGSLDYIDEKTGETKDRGYIFPCRYKKKIKSFTQSAIGHALRKNYAADPLEITVLKFTPHDLRRTAITNFARLKIPNEWRERIVNHLPKDLDATYNLYEYDDEKVTSMLKWEADLRRMLNLQLV